jgi:hypothetical protein
MTNALQKQSGETFQSWANRIHEKFLFYEGWGSFPNTETMMRSYIDIIQECMNRPNIYQCYYCCDPLDHGHDPVKREKILHMHELICSGIWDFNRKNAAAKKVQTDVDCAWKK